MPDKTEDTLSHLHPNTKMLMNQPNSARIEYINEDRWINHEACSSIRNKVKSLLFLPHTSQATCFLIAGIGGTGKSSLLNKISSDAKNWAQRRSIATPHITLRLSADPTLTNVIKSICEKFGIAALSTRKDEIPSEIVKIMQARQIKTILIDEFNHLLSVNRTEQRKNLNFFKNLTGPPLSLNIIAFGTHEAFNAIKLDIQLLSRFQVFELNCWQPGDELRAFLASYEQFLPLRHPSNLSSRSFIDFFTASLEPTTRNIVNRLKWAAMSSILNGTERILIDTLEKATSLPDLTGEYDDE